MSLSGTLTAKETVLAAPDRPGFSLAMGVVGMPKPGLCRAR